MRWFPALIGLTLCLLAAAPAQAADDWSLATWAKGASGWKGHGVGSTFTEETVTPMGQMPNMPNMPEVPGIKDGKMVSTTKRTLVKITQAGYQIKVEHTSMGRSTSRVETEPRTRAFEPRTKDLGEGAVVVEGKSYDCKIVQVQNMNALLGDAMKKSSGKKGAAPTLGAGKLWEHPKLGVLQIEATAKAMGQTAKITWRVQRFAVAREVGGHRFSCREITVATSVGQMGTSKKTMLVSPAFPGGSLSDVVESDFMGRKQKITTTVTAYVKKPLPVPAGG